MDIEALKARWSQARQFDIEFRGATFHYHLPDDFQIRGIAKEGRQENDKFDVDIWMLELFKRSLIGWDGVTESTLVDEPVTEASQIVPFDRELAVALVKEYRVAWNALVESLDDRIMERRKSKEEAAKN